MSDIILIIPAYNEEANISSVVEGIKRDAPYADYIIVNDGSSDSTARICRENGYDILDLPVNLGLAGAFQTGMRYAYERGYEAAVQFDGDGQHRAEFVKAMKQKLDTGFDIVIASRFLTKKKPFTMRMLGSRLIELAILFTTGVRINDPTSGMRMYNKRAIEEFACNINYAPEPDTVSYLLKQGASVAEVQAEMDERAGGVSYLTPFNSAKYMLRMLTSILFIQNFRKRDKRYELDA